MKTTLKRLVLVGFLLGSLGIVGITNAADPALKTLAPNTLYARFLGDFEKITSAQYEVLMSFEVYKDIDEEDPAYAIFAHSKGTANSSSQDGQLADSSASAMYWQADSESSVEARMDIVTTNGEVLVRFPDAANK